MAYSQNLRELMEKNKVSSYKLARSVGVHTSTVTNWLNGKMPSLDHLQSVAKFFGVTVNDLISS